MSHSVSPSSQRNPYTSLERDLALILLSVILALLAVRLGVVNQIVSLAEEGRIIGSFIAGVFFTSAFTIAPASIALAKISESMPAIMVAFWGACGAVVGDLVIFLFVRDRFADDILEVLHAFRSRRLKTFFHRGFFRWFTPIVGALIIASPLPDEIGLTMMGLSKIRTSRLIAISFVMNFLGVLLVAFIAGTL